MKDDISIAPANKNFSSQDVLNMALGTLISKQMITILKSSKSISLSQIFKLFAIMSLDEIRIGFMNLIKKIFGIIGSNYLTILRYIDKYILKNIFVRMFKNLLNIFIKWGLKPLLVIGYDQEPPVNRINIKFTPTLDFMKNFIKYVRPENYTIAPTHNIKLQVGNVLTYKQTWLNIKTIYDGISLNLCSNLSLTFEKVNNNVNLIKFSVKNANPKNTTEPSHKIELELSSEDCEESELYQKFNNFIFYINSYL
jgi:hypothetical protein